MLLTERQEQTILKAVNVKDDGSTGIMVMAGKADPPMLISAWDLVVVGELWFVANVD